MRWPGAPRHPRAADRAMGVTTGAPEHTNVALQPRSPRRMRRNGPPLIPKKPDPDPDPEAPIGILADPVLEMRFQRLVTAGFEKKTAAKLAFRRTDVDLHEAETLVKSAGPELAAEILL